MRGVLGDVQPFTPFAIYLLPAEAIELLAELGRVVAELPDEGLDYPFDREDSRPRRH